MARIVKAHEARGFWAHPSQHVGATEADLPETGVLYMASGPICAGFRLAGYPGVYFADYGVKPEGWGRLTDPAKEILAEFWRMASPELIIGWTEASNRAALAFAKRIGFRETGQMSLTSGALVAQEWRPEWA